MTLQSESQAGRRASHNSRFGGLASGKKNKAGKSVLERV